MRKSKPDFTRIVGMPEGDGYKALPDAFQRIAPDRTVLVFPGTKTFQEFWLKFSMKPWEEIDGVRVLVLWSRPVRPACQVDWRDHLVCEQNVSQYRFALIPAPIPGDWGDWLADLLRDWAPLRQDAEPIAVKLGSLVEAGGQTAQGFDAGFITVPPFGQMNKLLEALDACRRTYHRVIGTEVSKRRKGVLEHVDKLLAKAPGSEGSQLGTALPVGEEVTSKQLGANLARATRASKFIIDRRALPRVLLLGDSGVGKTLIAQYLARRVALADGVSHEAFQRVPIPLYLEREEAFEHEVFGYCGGSYTGARKQGSRGVLLERMGGVVFFDEIGDASRALQAKLLAYLDDYQVSPIGWEGDPIPCPVLVVAATNRPLDAWVQAAKGDNDARFRNDLFQRFTVIVHIPSLRDRLGELEYLVEALLSVEVINPGRSVKGMGTKALEALRAAIDDGKFDQGNFRMLEAVIRGACEQARAQNRDCLLVSDVTAQLTA